MNIELIVHTENFNSRSPHDVLAKYQNYLRPQNYAFHRGKSHCLLTKRISVVSVLLFTICVTMGKVPKISVTQFLISKIRVMVYVLTSSDDCRNEAQVRNWFQKSSENFKVLWSWFHMTLFAPPLVVFTEPTHITRDFITPKATH